MTADVSPIFPTGDLADDTVRRTVAALIEGRGLTVERAADLAGISRSTLYRRLNGKGSQQAFSAGEVATLARALSVRVGDLYEGLGGVFIPPQPPPPDGNPASPGIESTHRYVTEDGGLGEVIPMQRESPDMPVRDERTAA